MQTNIADVAKKAGVSIATVSRTFKHPELVAEKTRTRVLGTAQKLNFSISRSASVFQAGQSFRVALLVNDRPSSWFNSHVYEGLDSVLKPSGYDIAFYQIGTSADRRQFFETLPIRRNVDAVIVTSFDISRDEVERLHSMNVPVAGINAMPQQAFTLSASIGDEEAMRSVVRHLTALGHRDIAYVTFPFTEQATNALHFSANLRAKGFIDECDSAGLKPTIISVPDNKRAIDTALTRLFSLETMPTAVCCEQDSLAIPLMGRLQGFGYNVPKDISITGFDDMSIAGQIGLTTVHQDPLAMGAATAQRILEAIDGNTPETAHRSIDTPLVFRNSTAPARDERFDAEVRPARPAASHI